MFSARRVSCGAVILALCVVPSVYADEPPTEPPGARIKPPIGATVSPVTSSPAGSPTADARIKPPIGEPAPDARVGSPLGEPSFFQLLLDWLQAQARIRPPIG